MNRVINEKLRAREALYNDRVLPLFGVTDWIVEYEPLEQADRLREEQIKDTQSKWVSLLLDHGFEVKLNEMNEFEVSGEGKPKETGAAMFSQAPQIMEGDVVDPAVESMKQQAGRMNIQTVRRKMGVELRRLTKDATKRLWNRDDPFTVQHDTLVKAKEIIDKHVELAAMVAEKKNMKDFKEKGEIKFTADDIKRMELRKTSLFEDYSEIIKDTLKNHEQGEGDFAPDQEDKWR